ncbi:hypothetical protein EYF80_010591 [Liparis tanakae]|uniref:Uncharacterized protein n=1 Tax=Liparis tanakae TaxID=230148 RepID=A0A4Z2IPN9_9TELE|nr:hypothetical protein EYF80_010591 [Liparis tanakae]
MSAAGADGYLAPSLDAVIKSDGDLDTTIMGSFANREICMLSEEFPQDTTKACNGCKRRDIRLAISFKQISRDNKQIKQSHGASKAQTRSVHHIRINASDFYIREKLLWRNYSE